MKIENLGIVALLVAGLILGWYLDEIIEWLVKLWC